MSKVRPLHSLPRLRQVSQHCQTPTCWTCHSPRLTPQAGSETVRRQLNPIAGARSTAALHGSGHMPGPSLILLHHQTAVHRLSEQPPTNTSSWAEHAACCRSSSHAPNRAHMRLQGRRRGSSPQAPPGSHRGSFSRSFARHRQAAREDVQGSSQACLVDLQGSQQAEALQPGQDPDQQQPCGMLALMWAVRL